MPMPLIARAIIFVIAAACLPISAASARENRAGSFDYYTLALSWSPTYCAEIGDARGDQQCAPRKAYAFVVHGLWPQYEKGWPQDCQSREAWVPQGVIDSVMDIMPSRKLIIHEWKKHGTCSGLSMEDYFSSVRFGFKKVLIPARYLSPQAPVRTTPQQLVTDFVKTNRGLNANMLSVQCGNARDEARLSELRVCFDKQGEFRACGANEQRACRARVLVMPPVR